MLSRLRSRDLIIVLRRVVAVLLALQLVYVLAGNLLLRSDLVKRAVTSAEGFHLDYASAYTLWPGRVHVSQLSLRVEDYNVQFEVALERAALDISLSELLAKRFRVTRLAAEGTRFRMRHKLIAIGADAERVAAYPPIRGFADPPYYVGLPSPSVSDEEAAELWEVHIENVAANVSELWVMEYRFQGRGRATGSFVVRPTRWVQVLPAELVLERGRLTLGEHLVAEQTSGRISCEIPDYDVQAVDGRQVFGEISTRVDLQLTAGKLDFLDAYLARFGRLHYSGDAAWQLALHIRKGIVEPGTRLSLQATPLTLHHPRAEVSGDVMLSFGRNEGAEHLALALSAPRLTTQSRRQGVAGPRFQGVQAGLLLKAVALTRDLSLGAAQLSVQEVVVPSLSYFEGNGTKLAGQASARLSLARDDSGGMAANAQLTSPDFRIARGAFAAQAATQLSLELRSRSSRPELHAQKLGLELNRATLQSGNKRSKPFGLVLDAAGLEVTPSSSPHARGRISVRVSSAEALLPLLVGSVLRELGDTALDLQALDGRAELELGRDELTLSRIDARSGRLRLRGHVAKRDRHPTGALLLSSGFINVGVTLKGGETELQPFVGDDWLEPKRPDAGS